MPSAEDGGKSEAGTPTPNSKASGAVPAAAAPEPETDQWVQCDRCRTWRVVPAQHWPSVEADTSEVSTARVALWQSASPQLTPGSRQSCCNLSLKTDLCLSGQVLTNVLRFCINRL